MSEAYTSLAQSLILVELGLNTNIADGYWEDNIGTPLLVPGNYSVHNKCREDKDYKKLTNRVLSPAWSMPALLDLIPEWGLKKPAPMTNGKYSCWDNECQHVCYGNTPMDAVVKMVTWLLENNYIDHG